MYKQLHPEDEIIQLAFICFLNFLTWHLKISYFISKTRAAQLVRAI